MTHPNEDRLRDLYGVFAQGDLQGFLDGCTDDVTFTVPGNTPGSGTFTKATFAEWITGVLGQTAGQVGRRGPMGRPTIFAAFGA